MGMMNLPLTHKAQSFNSVAAGQTATLRLEIGYTYKHIELEYSGVTLAQLSAIRLKANGNTVRDMPSGADIDVMNQYDGLAAAAGVLVLNFERTMMNTRVEREYTQIGTGYPQNMDSKSPNYNPQVIDTLMLEVDIDAAAAAPVLSARVERDGPAPLGRILRLEKYMVDVTAVGDKHIDWIPKGDPINRIFFNSANIASHIMRVDQVERQNRTKAGNELAQTNGVRTPQASWYVIDTTERGDGLVGIDTNVNDLRFILSMSATGTFPMYVERIGRL